MLDLLAVHLALRNRALSVVVATTGSATLSATATGYARAAGSFVTDGFTVGMEVAVAGFATNTPRVLTGVSALALTTSTAVPVEAPAAGRTLSVGLPLLRAYENVAFSPTVGRPYVEEDFVPATSSLFTMPADGGRSEETGLYVVKLYGLDGGVIPNIGVSALRKAGDALKRIFAPGTVLTAGADTVGVRVDTAPQTGQIIPLGGGWAVLVITIPWYASSLNAVVA